MKNNSKYSVAAGIAIFVLAALFSVSLLLVAVDFGGMSGTHSSFLYKTGRMLAGAYGFCSVCIPVFLIASALQCFSSNWSIKNGIVLIGSVIPFFTLDAIEHIIRMLTESEAAGVMSVKIGAAVLIGSLLVAAEFILLMILGEVVKGKFEQNKTVPQNDNGEELIFADSSDSELPVDEDTELEDEDDDIIAQFEGENLKDFDNLIPEETSIDEDELDSFDNLPDTAGQENLQVQDEKTLSENEAAPAENPGDSNEQAEQKDKEPFDFENDRIFNEQKRLLKDLITVGKSDEEKQKFEEELSLREKEEKKIAEKEAEKEPFDFKFPESEPIVFDDDEEEKDTVEEDSSDKTEIDFEPVIAEEFSQKTEVVENEPPLEEETFAEPPVSKVETQYETLPDNFFDDEDDEDRSLNSVEGIDDEDIIEDDETSADDDFNLNVSFDDEDEKQDADTNIEENFDEEAEEKIDTEEINAEDEIENDFSEPELSETEEDVTQADDEFEIPDFTDDDYEDSGSEEIDAEEEIEEDVFNESDGQNETDGVNNDYAENEVLEDDDDDVIEESAADEETEEEADFEDDNDVEDESARKILPQAERKTGSLLQRAKAIADASKLSVTEKEAGITEEDDPYERAKKLRIAGYKISPELLNKYENGQYWIIDDETKKAGEYLRKTLNEFGIEAQVTGIRKGPVVTMFELLPAPGVKLSRIVSLQDNIALALAASSVRIVAPIPGKHAVGIEVPNRVRAVVSFREIIEMDIPEFKKMQIPVILGKDISGEPHVIDLTKTPHLLIAGSTGAGKSVCVNSMILSILYKRSPEQVKLVLIDPKVVELKLYNDIPHLLTPVITEPKRALQSLQYCLCEMERRYACLDGMGVRDIVSYNKKIVEKKIATEKLPYIVVIIDEFADLMATTGKELESCVARLAAMSRAVGIHLVLATQRPSVNVITGLIKANIPSRIAFMVASRQDSQIIIDGIGAEKLLGKGDMLYSSATDPFPTRIQGTLVGDDEVERVVNACKQYGEPEYIDDEIFVDDDEEESAGPGIFSDGEDPLYDQALQIVVQAGKASASYIQRRLKIGYNRAARLVEEMEERGIVGPQNGSKPREVIHIPS